LNAEENRTKDVSTTSQKPTAPIPHNLTKLTSNFDKHIPNNPQKKQQSQMENNTMFLDTMITIQTPKMG